MHPWAYEPDTLHLGALHLEIWKLGSHAPGCVEVFPLFLFFINVWYSILFQCLCAVALSPSRGVVQCGPCMELVCHHLLASKWSSKASMCNVHDNNPAVLISVYIESQVIGTRRVCRSKRNGMLELQTHSHGLSVKCSGNTCAFTEYRVKIAWF